MRALSSLALFAAACSCPRPSHGPQAHYAGFGALTHAVVQGDRATIAERAQGLDGGDPVLTVSARGQRAELDLHSAAGFLMVAMDGVEAGEGLAAVARACGECHAAEGVAHIGSSAGTPETHGVRFDAALRALERGGQVWEEAALAGIEEVPFPEAGPLVAERVRTLRAQLEEIDGQGTDRLEAVVGVAYGECAGCHGPE
jgi:cytochrome c553